jgi:hypothetical protein
MSNFFTYYSHSNGAGRSLPASKTFSRNKYVINLSNNLMLRVKQKDLHVFFLQPFGDKTQEHPSVVY